MAEDVTLIKHQLLRDLFGLQSLFALRSHKSCGARSNVTSEISGKAAGPPLHPGRQVSATNKLLRTPFTPPPVTCLGETEHTVNPDAVLLHPLAGQNISNNSVHTLTNAHGTYSSRREGTNVSIIGDTAGTGSLLLQGHATHCTNPTSRRGSTSGYMHSVSGCIRLTPSSPAWMLALGSAVMDRQGLASPAMAILPLTPSIHADLVLGTDVVVDYRKGMLGEVRMHGAYTQARAHVWHCRGMHSTVRSATSMHAAPFGTT